MSRGIGTGMRKMYSGENSLLGKESRLNMYTSNLSPSQKLNEMTVRRLFSSKTQAYKDKENRREKTKAMQY